MRNTLFRNSIVTFILLLGIWFNLGCGPVTPYPTSTPTRTPTRTPIPTRTPTRTPVPSPTMTLAPIPTRSIQNPSAISLNDECRRVVDGLYDLKKDLGFPEHLMSENPVHKDTDFDPNQYFQVLSHLSIASGYQLDYLYFNDELGGKPLVYARRSSAAPFKSYEEFLQSFGEEMSSERSYGSLGHKYDYLEKIQIDGSPESYFEFVTLAYLGDQFYLWWHGLYNDLKILCDPSDIGRVNEDVQGWEQELPQIQNGVMQIDYTPMVLVEDTRVTVRYVSFTKWGGFYENVYVMDRNKPMNLLDVKFNILIEYDCGIAF